MSDQQTLAHKVTYWRGIGGVKIPAELTEALDVFETLQWLEVDHRPVFNIEEVTEANAEQKVREYADQLLLSDSADGVNSVLHKAKTRAVDLAAGQVIRQARVAVPEIIEKLAPGFDQHAKAYTEAVLKLPKDLTAETLVAAGPEAVAVYGQARQEFVHLNRYSEWVFEAGVVTGSGMIVNAEPVLRILRPTDVLQLQELDAAHARNKVDRILAVLNPVWFAAARNGIEFGMNTLKEARALRKGLSTFSASQVSFV